jgi:hypothetical protein
VTHIRELNGSDEHLRWRQEINEGRMGPKIFVASSRLNSNGVFKGWFDSWMAKITSIGAPEGAEKILQSFASKKYDAVKVYSKLSSESFSAVNEAAEKVGIPIFGHIPMSVVLEDVWNSNLNELTHIEEIVKALDREFVGHDSSSSFAIGHGYSG